MRVSSHPRAFPCMFPPLSKRACFQLVLVLSALLATASAALLAYGEDPYWAQFDRGLGFICFTHRLQGVLATLSVLMCLTVVALIVGGRRRVWWLIVLGPVQALFVHRLLSNPMRDYAIVENPACVKAEAAAGIRDSDAVVGVQFGDVAYAYPYESLFTTPVILQSIHEQRFILIWSAFANRAMAFKVDHEIKLGELQLVSMPANALLLYNGRVGQFINGLTGETTKHEKPAGFHGAVQTRKLNWQQWRKLHPGTFVLQPSQRGPTAALTPSYPLHRSAATQPTGTQVIFAPTTRPVAIPIESVGLEPANISAGQMQLLMFRDQETGLLKAFERRVNEDLFPIFRRKTDPKRPAVAMEDQDSGTEWSADGKGIEGPFKGEQLKPFAVEDAVNWSVMKDWYPDLQWVTPTPTSGGPGNFKNPGETKRRAPKPKKITD